METAEQIMMIEKMISEIEIKHNIIEGTIKLMPILESAVGIVNAPSIAYGSKRNTAISIGGEDFTADLGIKRSKSGAELDYSRAQVVIAARAAGIDPVDTVFSDVNDEEGLIHETIKIRDMGFVGKSIVNPRQIIPIHKAFTPTDEEIEKSKKIIEAMEEAKEQGLGVVSLNGRMIDKPVLKRAEQTIAYAKAVGKL
jgi:citrate lyase subunit beta/citryl-CoA lyase